MTLPAGGVGAAEVNAGGIAASGGKTDGKGKQWDAWNNGYGTDVCFKNLKLIQKNLLSMQEALFNRTNKILEIIGKTLNFTNCSTVCSDKVC